MNIVDIQLQSHGNSKRRTVFYPFSKGFFYKQINFFYKAHFSLQSFFITDINFFKQPKIALCKKKWQYFF